MPKVNGREPLLLRILKKKKKKKQPKKPTQPTLKDSMKIAEKFAKENP